MRRTLAFVALMLCWWVTYCLVSCQNTDRLSKATFADATVPECPVCQACAQPADGGFADAAADAGDPLWLTADAGPGDVGGVPCVLWAKQPDGTLVAVCGFQSGLDEADFDLLCEDDLASYPPGYPDIIGVGCGCYGFDYSPPPGLGPCLPPY
jgi:hypothetical protein